MSLLRRRVTFSPYRALSSLFRFISLLRRFFLPFTGKTKISAKKYTVYRVIFRSLGLPPKSHPADTQRPKPLTCVRVGNEPLNAQIAQRKFPRYLQRAFVVDVSSGKHSCSEIWRFFVEKNRRTLLLRTMCARRASSARLTRFVFVRAKKKEIRFRAVLSRENGKLETYRTATYTRRGRDLILVRGKIWEKVCSLIFYVFVYLFV